MYRPPPPRSGDERPREVFPRLRERDAFKILGISKDASYQEIQDARNYLVDTYKVRKLPSALVG